MKVAAYPHYKPSPISWLDQMPEHWGAGALRWMSRRYAGGTPDKGNEAYWADGEIPWINSGAVNDGYITEPSALISHEGFANSSARWIPKDALVMALAGQGKTKGMVAQLGIKTTCNQSMAAIIPDHRFAPRYLYWWLIANYQNIRNLAGGEARDGLNLDMLGSIPCPVPPLEEQQTIARFLDAQTTRIDSLIAKKRQLIAKLKEKRSALIARTVTCGLPPEAAKAAGLEPNPAMKDSGVEWLDRLPEHWNVLRLKHVLKVKKGAIKTGPFGSQLHSSEMLDTEIKVYNQRNVIDRDIRGGDNYVSLEKFKYLKAFEVFPGDLLVTTRGTIGRCLVIPENAEHGILHPCLMRLQLDSSVVKDRYLEILIEDSGSVLDQLKVMSNATTIEVIYSETLKEVWLPMPPANEQEIIIAYLDREMAELDALTDGVGSAVDRITEYRQALITAAVTGKIDVQEAAA